MRRPHDDAAPALMHAFATAVAEHEALAAGRYVLVSATVPRTEGAGWWRMTEVWRRGATRERVVVRRRFRFPNTEAPDPL